MRRAHNVVPEVAVAEVVYQTNSTMEAMVEVLAVVALTGARLRS